MLGFTTLTKRHQADIEMERFFMFKLKHNGKDKDVELGAVIWVKFHDWQ
jgi:hypothetical protein